MGFGIEEQKAVERVMKKGILSDYKGNWSDKFFGGEEIQALEKEWARHVRVKHAIACNSATSALYASLGAIGIKAGDEVLVTPFSMTCSASIPILFGAKPVFVDIEDIYFNIDPSKIENKITEKTKAIIVVNLFGHPYDVEKINAIAKKNNLYVIEDSAQAPMASNNGKMCGSLGDVGCFSLNYHKHIHAGEGGMMTTDDDELAMRCRLMINHAEAIVNGMVQEGLPYYDMIGMNLRMTELQAAIAREQLKKLPSIIDGYRRYARMFDIPLMDNCTHSYYRYAFLNTDDYKLEELNPDDAMFDIKKHYITPIHRMPYFKHNGYPQDDCPVADYVNESIVLIWLKEPL